MDAYKTSLNFKNKKWNYYQIAQNVTIIQI